MAFLFQKKNGLTIIEVLLVIGLLTILIGLVPLSLDFYRSQQLNIYTQGAIQTLRRAQLKAMSIEDDSSFGVYLTNDNYILFKGDSYLNRDKEFDEVFDLSQIITVKGFQEIVFSKFEGIPESPAYCGGECVSCKDFTDKRSCKKQDGCSWQKQQSLCIGTCTSCDGFSDQTSCEDQSGCSWYPPSQGGSIVLSSNSDSRTININEIGRINLEL